MKYSILITYYQGENIIKTALNLLCKSLGDRKDIEIIISCDNPKLDISELEKIDPLSRIKTINTHINGGYSVACNRAAQIAQGEYIILMDSDIFVTSGWLEGLEDVYVKKENVGCVSCTILNLNNGGVVHWGLALMGVEVLKPFRDGQLPEKLKNTITEFPLLTSGCLMVKRSVYERVGGMDADFYNGYCDLDFTFKIHRMNFINYATTNSIVYHRGKIAGQIRIMGEEDTRALFFSRWGNTLPSNGIETYQTLLRLADIPHNKEYVFCNFSKSLYLLHYKNAIQSVFNCNFSCDYELKNISMPALMEDVLPWDMCAISLPFIYFCDNINSLIQNRHWFFHRKGKGDLLIDRNGNILDTDKIYQ